MIAQLLSMLLLSQNKGTFYLKLLPEIVFVYCKCNVMSTWRPGYCTSQTVLDKEDYAVNKWELEEYLRLPVYEKLLIFYVNLKIFSEKNYFYSVLHFVI